MKLFIISCVILFCNSINAQFISYGRIEPNDESASDPSFNIYIEELRRTISNKDAAVLYNVHYDSIQFSFGDEIQSKK